MAKESLTKRPILAQPQLFQLCTQADGMWQTPGPLNALFNTFFHGATSIVLGGSSTFNKFYIQAMISIFNFQGQISQGQIPKVRFCIQTMIFLVPTHLSDFVFKQ